MIKPPIDVPSLPDRKDATERAALAQSSPLLPLIEENGTDHGPVVFEKSLPFAKGWSGVFRHPSAAKASGFPESRALRIPVYARNDGDGKRKTPLINIFMTPHVGRLSRGGKAIK
jgi:hypothetical protein